MTNNQLQQKIESFTQKCQQFNWFYEYQDSFENNGFNSGFEEHKKLLKEVEQIPELQVIYDEYCPFIN